MKDIKLDELTTVFVPLSLRSLRSLYGLIKFLRHNDIDLSSLSDLDRYLSGIISQVEGLKPETKDS